MRLTFLLLSPTYGMHQYTADLANRFANQGNEVHLVTTSLVPRDRYAPGVHIHDPVRCSDRGFSLQGFKFWDFIRVLRSILQTNPDLVHFTGPHLWNPLLLSIFKIARVPTVHTLHDLHPHAGAVYGRLLYLWNGWVKHAANHLLVHGQRYREELLDRKVAPARVTCSPLTHLFLSYTLEQQLIESLPVLNYEPWALLFARLEKYKGLDVVFDAIRLAGEDGCSLKVILAGKSHPTYNVSKDSAPAGVEVRDRYIQDDEALDLFCRCGLVMLPYIEASQSALISAAYFFRKPVVVTCTGALPEYVEDGTTGWVIPPQDPNALRMVLESALVDPDKLALMGEAGRKWFDRQRVVETETLQVMYNSILSVKKKKNRERRRVQSR